MEGFERALREAGLEIDPRATARGDGRYAGGERAMLELLSGYRDLTAVFAYNDLMAIGAVAALRRAGLRVPDDVSVIGFDDSPLIAFTDPPLTTLRQPVTAMAVAAVRSLMDEINGHGAPHSEYLFRPELVVRDSTAIAPARREMRVESPAA